MRKSKRWIKKTVGAYLKKKGLPPDIAVTFKNVTIPDRYSRIPTRYTLQEKMPSSTRTRVAQDIYLNIPITSANMDTVTESQMAIAMARLGGLGFIHQFLPIEKRAKEIELVKRADSGVIEQPLMAKQNITLGGAKTLMASYKISSLLVTDSTGERLIGILSHRDYAFETDNTKPIGKLMTKKNLITAHPETTTEQARQILKKHRIEKLPLIDADGKIAGLITSKDIEKAEHFLKAARDAKGRLIVGGTVGITGNFLGEIEKLLIAEADIILVDTARGNSKRMVDTLRTIRRRFGKKLPLVAGNIDTPDGCIRLIEAGADCVKVGIGGGSACKTREGPGIGIPQLSAIAECFAVSRHYDIPIIGDGGITTSSDLSKALVAGAAAVMLGGILAGTQETPGRSFYEDGKRWKIFRGSASVEFQMSRIDREDHQGLIRAPEGVPKRVEPKGEVQEVIEELMGHLYSAMSYVDAESLDELQEKAFFRHQTSSGYEEGKPHDVF